VIKQRKEDITLASSKADQLTDPVPIRPELTEFIGELVRLKSMLESPKARGALDPEAIAIVTSLIAKLSESAECLAVERELVAATIQKLKAEIAAK